MEGGRCGRDVVSDHRRERRESEGGKEKKREEHGGEVIGGPPAGCGRHKYCMQLHECETSTLVPWSFLKKSPITVKSIMDFPASLKFLFLRKTMRGTRAVVHVP